MTIVVHCLTVHSVMYLCLYWPQFYSDPRLSTFEKMDVAPDILAGKNFSEATEHCFKTKGCGTEPIVCSIETCQQCWTKQRAGMNHLTVVVSVR